MKLPQLIATVYTITLCNFLSYLLKITSNLSLLERGIGIIFEGTLVILSLVLIYKTFFEKEKQQEILSINSVEFWKKVLFEYVVQSKYWLCKSATFKTAYYDDDCKLQIIEWAKLFLSENPQYYDWEISKSFLYLFNKKNPNCEDEVYTPFAVDVRLAFIRWIIDHLNKKYI